MSGAFGSLLLAVVLALAWGCSERTGNRAEAAVDNTGDAITSGAEDLGDHVEEGTDELHEAVDDDPQPVD